MTSVAERSGGLGHNSSSSASKMVVNDSGLVHEGSLASLAWQHLWNSAQKVSISHPQRINQV